MPIVVSETYNYTFNSLGTIGSIILLNYIATPSIKTFDVTFFHIGSLIGIIIVSNNYFKYFESTRYCTDSLPTPILPPSLPSNTKLPDNTSYEKKSYLNTSIPYKPVILDPPSSTRPILDTITKINKSYTPNIESVPYTDISSENVLKKKVVFNTEPVPSTSSNLPDINSYKS